MKMLKRRIRALENIPEKQDCPSGWLRFRSSCYGIGDDTITWGAAQEACRLFGGSLAEVETSAENEFLKNIARTRNYENMWLGATDMFDEGNFTWAGNQTPLKQGVDFTDWGVDEPNDGGNEDCLHLWKAKDYKWNDAECYQDQNFACEIKLE